VKPRVVVVVCTLLLVACGGGSGSGAPRVADPGTAAPAARAGGDVPAWATYHADAGHTGVDPSSPQLASPHVLWRSPALDGAVYAEPLIAGGRVIAATEGDSVYALDATRGAVVWRTTLGVPEPRSQLPCGDIFPLGITGTPVIDTGAQVVYAVAETVGGHHTLAALDLATGHIRWQRGVDPPGMNAVTEQQRAALVLAGGRVYVAFGGLFGDCGPYHGWVVGVAANGSGPLLDVRVPSGREAGIWASAGPVVDSGGDLIVATGNSESATTFDDGNAVLRLSADLRQLDVWAPADWAALNTTDSDIGSISPAPVGSGLLFQTGKRGIGYLLRAGHLGGVGGQAFAAPVCPGGAYGGTAFSGGLLYVPCRDGLRGVRIGPGTSFSVAWTGPDTGPPILAGGAVWAVGFGQATLHALDPATGRELAQVQVGPTVHFATPASAGGLLVIGSGATIVAVTGV
jgi:outer membrane protein assembly factor BamB